MSPNRVLAVVVAVCAAALLPACSADSPSSPPISPSASFDDARRAQVDATLKDVFGAERSTSWMVLVSQPGSGEMYFQGGDTARDRNWRIGSVTKTFTGIAVLRLAQQGKLTLEDKLDKYVPGIANGNEITIRQLLHMTAGVYDFVQSKRFMTAYEDNPAMPWAVDQTIELTRKGKPEYPPGTSIAYDDANFVLLGRILEKVTGLPAAEVLQEQAIAPAGLRHTVVPAGDTVPPPAVAGNYYSDSGELRQTPDQNPQIPFTAGNMVSQVDDLKTWSQALATGALLDPEYFRQQKQFQPLGGGADYGLGLMNWAGWLGHTGYIFGYSNITVTDPDTGATVVSMSTGGPVDSAAPSKAFMIVVNELWPGKYPAIDAAVAKLKATQQAGPS